jgi:hypothetical protein
MRPKLFGAIAKAIIYARKPRALRLNPSRFYFANATPGIIKLMIFFRPVAAIGFCLQPRRPMIRSRSLRLGGGCHHGAAYCRQGRCEN